MAAARSPWLHIHHPKGNTMTSPNPERTPAPDSIPAPDQAPAAQPPAYGQPPHFEAPRQPTPQPPYPGQPGAPQQQPYQAPPQFQAPQQPYYAQPGPEQQPYPGQQPGPQQPQYYAQPQNPAYGYAEPKSKIVAGLLGLFLGGLGIHRFYLGYTTIGVIQLVLSFVTFGIASLWGFVEGILILVGYESFRRDARGVPLRD
ncbi:hypothetical protein BIU82_04500 [Arthrobacter sp. SW1]|nr:hypothetical protein BIU82_04500 [Arthrobacter sp. SW1]